MGTRLMTIKEEKAEDEPKFIPPIDFKQREIIHAEKTDIVKVKKALKVIVLDSRIRAFLETNDPKALEQVLGAIKIMEDWEKYRNWLDGVDWD